MSNGAEMPSTARRGRGAPRSRNGCWTCRERKVKCDEETPACQRCIQAGRGCTYVAPPGRLKRALRVPSAAGSLASAASPASAAATPAYAVATPASAASLTSPAISQSPGAAGSTQQAAGEPDGSDEPEVDGHIMKYYKEQYLSFLMTKSPEWSFISGIVYLGRTNSAVMSFIMANVQFQASGVEQRQGDRYQALQHYQSGLRDFTALVASGEYDPLTLLSTLFLLVQFELRHADQADSISNHLQAFGVAILAYGGQLVPDLDAGGGKHRRAQAGEADPPVQVRYRNVLNRLGLWMVYMDAVASTWDLGGTVMHAVTEYFPGSLDTIFSESREAGQEIWGADYPTSEALDDLQNRPAFDLYHEAHVLRYNISCFRRLVEARPGSSGAIGAEAAPLQLRIEMTIEKLYRDHKLLLRIASQWPDPDAAVSRIVLNLHFIVPFFLASVAEFDFIAARDKDPSPRASRAVADIMRTAAIVHETEQPNAMCRLAWPLFVAATSTTDFAYQSWILDRFAALESFGTNYRRAHALLRAVVQQQRRSDVRFPYREWIKNKPEFII